MTSSIPSYHRSPRREFLRNGLGIGVGCWIAAGG